MEGTMHPMALSPEAFMFYPVEKRQHLLQPQHMYPNIPVSMHLSQPSPTTPTLYSNGPSVMTPMASPQPLPIKTSMVIRTQPDFEQLPQTPPLSTPGSVVGSPGHQLMTPVNPMVSGYDGDLNELKDSMPNFDMTFSNTPPLTPNDFNANSSDSASCPSLSPSPAPDYLDPRALLGGEAKPTPDSAALPDLANFDETSDFESFVSFDDAASADSRRPRADTGCSSVVSLGNDSFTTFESQFPILPTSPVSECDSDAHRHKRARTSSISEMPIIHNATTASEPAAQPQLTGSEESKNNGESTEASTPTAPNPPPANRRGRKQSLTEDPSKTFVCDLCSRRFRRQEHLKRHYRSLHTTEKPFSCNECGKKFSRSDNLAQHARTHGSGAIPLDVLDDPYASHHLGHAHAPNPEMQRYGQVLFQFCASIPGSSSESSDEDVADNKKKRKRSE